LQNQPPAADVYFGRGNIILLQRERIKRHTIAQRRLQHQRQAAWDAHELDHPVEEPWWTRQRTPGG
jgi:hypothetical protein